MAKKDVQTKISEYIYKQVPLDFSDYVLLKDVQKELRQRDGKKYSISDTIRIIIDERRSKK